MLKLYAPAKINWSLFVLNKRCDGYHNIQSLMHCIKLFDELILEEAEKIDIVSDLDIPLEFNLVYKALFALKERYHIDKGARIILKKSIPIGAGLGGGSSDAASTLLGLNRLWGLSLNREELIEVALRIGSDVPFFFYCPIAIVEGRGEKITPLKIETSYTLLLVKPSIHISTQWAYSKLTEKRSQESQSFFKNELTKCVNYSDNIKLIYKALFHRSIDQLKNLLKNDFEPVITAHFEIIDEIKDKLLKKGASVAMMSGSGSAVFGVFRDKEEALIASKDFQSHWHLVVETCKSL
ncbi:MAG: 4-(cytidine 5'-diphospho)-2-C-methyl-D-erythritol kinase [Thermodesulfovibrionales bacterium]|nr:4-(cytidine 5'-diphospho)-2-C-methyl-D-erythritol kinase [Thermodesulfovibrionales bacterium]